MLVYPEESPDASDPRQFHYDKLRSVACKSRDDAWQAKSRFQRTPDECHGTWCHYANRNTETSCCVGGQSEAWWISYRCTDLSQHGASTTRRNV